jgi:cytochrome c biogenesis protein CcdA
MSDFIARIGTFFLLVGVVFVIMFAATESAAQPVFDYLFVAIILLTTGVLFRRRGAAPSASGRFSWLRNMREEQQKRKEAAKQKPKK